MTSCASCGRTLSRSPQACRRCSARSSSRSASTSPDKPLFLLRRWYPQLFPWSEQAAFEFFLEKAFLLAGALGLAGGVLLGYSAAGIGGALVVGALLAAFSAVLGAIVGLLGPALIVMLLNAAIVLAPVALAAGVLSALWGVRL